jgi:hypothetical protein
MATRKKKDSITLEMPGTIGSAKIILPETKVIKGKKKRLKVESELKLQLGSVSDSVVRKVLGGN